MATYNFQQLVERFFNGEVTGISSGGGNLKIAGNKLIHFETIIAERSDGIFFVNITRYSLQTGRLQKIIRSTIPSNLTVEVKRVPKGFKGELSAYRDENDHWC